MAKSNCAVCSSKKKLRPGAFVHRAQVGEVFFDGEIPADTCSDCGEIYVNAQALQRFELFVAKHLAENNQRTPEAFRYMRKALGMRAVDLAQLIGVGSETISRYETGAREIDPVRFGVLATLIIESLAGREDTLHRFKTVHQPVKRMPRKVVLKVA